MPGIAGVIRNVQAGALSPRYWWLARQSVRKYGAIQHIDELTRFLCMLPEPPRVVLEIGSAQGGMFWLLCQVSAPDALLVSLDLPPEQKNSGGLPQAIDLQRLKRSGQTVHAIDGDSHNPETVDRVRAILGDRKVDVLFIDGDHTYNGVRRDYEMYKPLLRAGGLIGFHDIIDTHWPECQVNRFWGELSTDPSLQPTAIVGSFPSHFGGIGVVRVPASH
jgi:cephalosporin hydroxylase